MKIRYFIINILLISILWTISIEAADNETATDNQQPTVSANAVKKTPQAVVAEPVFQASPVIEGNDIVHTFIIKNTGNETLNISRVKTG